MTALLNRGRTPEVGLRLPLPVLPVSGAASVVQVTARARTLPAGTNTTGSFVISPAPIASNRGDLVGRFGDTSLSFSGTLTTEVSFQAVANRYREANPTAIIDHNDPTQDLSSVLANGEYWVVYETGLVRYRKSGSGTSITETYIYRADAGNTLTQVFDGTTWQNMRGGVITPSATVTGMANVLPWAFFNTSPTVRTNGQGGPLEADPNGNLKVTLGTRLFGENEAGRMMMSRPGTPVRITSAATTVAVTGSGAIIGFLVEVAFTGTATVYDNVAGSGPVMTILPIGTPAGFHPFNARFNTGCTLVTTAADRIVVVTEPN